MEPNGLIDTYQNILIYVVIKVLLAENEIAHGAVMEIPAASFSIEIHRRLTKI
jgi:hypothetical protein